MKLPLENTSLRLKEARQQAGFLKSRYDGHTDSI